MAFRAQDAKLFLRDGETAELVADGSLFPVLLDFPEDLADLGGLSRPGVVQGKPQITYETAAVMLTSGAEIIIGGTTYKVGAPRKINDGVLSVADLKA